MTAPVAGQVGSKMWKVKDFQKKTDEGLLTQAGTAQKKIVAMITTYLSQYSSGGAVSNKDLGKAVDLLLQMRQSVNWWINDHTVDVDNGLGGVSTVEDPKRKKRMAGMKEFRTFVDSEIGGLQAQQRKVGDDVTEEITEKHPGFLKVETRYDGNVRSMLAKVGEIVDQAVPRNGDWIELELEFQVPCDPSGVGYLGGRLKASAFKEDDFVKVRAELAITGGASVDFATIGGEVGGYLEAQADTAAGAMTLMSYGMYRRFKESHALPAEMSSYLWGGNAGTYGKGKAEQWSLDVEKEYFDTDDPTRQESVYVETGAKAAVGADLDAEVFTASVGATASTGRRTDFTSLQNRKGGAGKANKASDSVLAQGTRALTGGSRGAQKRTGRDVYGTSLSASMEVGLPGVGEHRLGIRRLPRLGQRRQQQDPDRRGAHHVAVAERAVAHHHCGLLVGRLARAGRFGDARGAGRAGDRVGPVGPHQEQGRSKRWRCDRSAQHRGRDGAARQCAHRSGRVGAVRGLRCAGRALRRVGRIEEAAGLRHSQGARDWHRGAERPEPHDVPLEPRRKAHL